MYLGIKILVNVNIDQLGQGVKVYHASWTDFSGEYLQSSSTCRSELEEKQCMKMFEFLALNSIEISLGIFEKKQKLLTELKQVKGVDELFTNRLEIENKLKRISRLMDNVDIDFAGAW
jgi:hypothetical protein